MTQFELQLLWPTRVIQRNTALPSSLLSTGRRAVLFATRSTDDQERHDLDVCVGRSCTDLAHESGIHLSHPDSPVWRIEEWPQGYGCALRAPVQGVLVYLCLNIADIDTPRSGAVSIHDPRVGCANVPLPGLPHGRPLTHAFTPGSYLAFPGWLAHGVIPVKLGDHRAMAIGVYS